MFEWKVEEMRLLNMNDAELIDLVRETDCEDKLQFLDERNNNKVSYILDLVEKFEKEKDTIKKDSWNNYKTISLKAWINRNDTKYGNSDYTRIVDSYYNYGKINFLGCQRYLYHFSRKSYCDTFDNYVSELFYRQLKKLKNEEKDYFEKHDEYEILKTKFKNRLFHHTFGVPICSWSDGRICIKNEADDTEREITKEELKKFLEYDNLFIELSNKIEKEIDIKF